MCVYGCGGQSVLAAFPMSMMSMKPMTMLFRGAMLLGMNVLNCARTIHIHIITPAAVNAATSTMTTTTTNAAHAHQASYVALSSCHSDSAVLKY